MECLLKLLHVDDTTLRSSTSKRSKVVFAYIYCMSAV